jgi:uncharacterized protein (TIGR03437 family)
VKLLTAGSCTIQASQAGNATYAVAAAVIQGFTVTHKDQTITFAALSNKPFGTAPFKLTATASSGLAVSFVTASSLVCTAAAATVTVVGVGTCAIEASQPGDASFGAALPVDQSFTVTLASQTITFGALANAALGIAPFKISAKASSGLAITFASNSGVCTVSDSTVTVALSGTCAIEASQPGNANYTAATPVTQRFTVTAGSQTITFGALSTQLFGTAPFTVTATASSGLGVSFASTTLAVCTVSDSTVTLLNIGTCTIKATQAGDGSYAGAGPVVQTFTVKPGPAAIGAILNAGSYAAIPIAPGAYIVAFGSNFSTATAQTPSLKLPTTLAGTTVKIQDSKGATQTAPLFYVSPAQINFLVPDGLAYGSAIITVTNQAGSTGILAATIAQVSPALFTADSSGAGAAAALALAFDSRPSPQVLPVFSCTNPPLVCGATPIDLGPAATSVYLELYGTGIKGRTGLSGVTAKIGAKALQVTYAGVQGTYAGLDQVNVLLDRSLTGQGALSLQLTVDGIAANPVLLNIK